MQRNPATLDETLALVRALLDSGKPDDAMHVIRQCGIASNELRNAQGVCLLRRGEYEKAIELYRNLVLNSGAVTVKQQAPDVYRRNFATALLLSGNVHGCLSMLADLRAPQDGGAARIRHAVQRWKQSLTRWQRWRFALGSTGIKTPVTLDFPPGELPPQPEPTRAPSQAA